MSSIKAYLRADVIKLKGMIMSWVEIEVRKRIVVLIISSI